MRGTATHSTCGVIVYDAASGFTFHRPTLSEPVFTIFIGRFDDIKAWIQGKKHSKVEYLARIFNAVATFLGH